MLDQKKIFDRRSFIKSSVLAGGGLMVSFNWIAACKSDREVEGLIEIPQEWFELNSYLKIGDNGVVTIFSPNPEFGQNVKTSMPMIVAEELDMDWKKVLVEQAPYNQDKYPGGAFGQFTGGSRGIMMKWKPLRTAGATAKHLLKQAAAQKWNVPFEEVTTSKGIIYHKNNGYQAHYGEVATAAANMVVPETVSFKKPSEYSIVGHSKRNVEGMNIVTGKPMFGLDYQKENMLFAMPVFPTAFGLTLETIINASEIKAMPGIVDVFPVKSYNDSYKKDFFDANSFPEFIAIVGKSTWEVMKAKKILQVNWKPIKSSTNTINRFGTDIIVNTPAGLENSSSHKNQMKRLMMEPMNVVRRDGNPEKAFESATKVIERAYAAPHLAHNCMEPMNAFAHVKNGKAFIAGPLQAPGLIEPTLSDTLGIPIENIEIEMTRMGGGFGRRAYSHYMVEAALISQKMKAPIKFMYTREDDMTNGIYRPSYRAVYRAAIDENNNLTAIHIKAGGVPESPLFANRFPAGSIENYLAEEFAIDSNISTGAFRAPRSNFMAGAEQSFLDELAQELQKDPIDFRLELLHKAKTNPTGATNDYDPDRYAGVLELVREKSGWKQNNTTNRGVSAYFCHNTYAAHVLDLRVVNNEPIVDKVTCAIDCGIVINPGSAKNMAEGGIIDGVGNALYGEMTFKDGMPEKNNFHQYRMIRMSEAPKEIDVCFVKNDIDPTGLGEPPFPPIFGALANAMFKATGKRFYEQPFLKNKDLLS